MTYYVSSGTLNLTKLKLKLSRVRWLKRGLLPRVTPTLVTPLTIWPIMCRVGR